MSLALASLVSLADGAGSQAALDGDLRAIEAACQALSARHRRSFPPELVRDRIQGLAPAAGALFQDRVIEICFLLDQNGSLRFNELRRLLGAVSTRTLADKLAFLQREGMVVRTLFESMPLRVDYRLSPRGRTLVDLLFPALLHVASTPAAQDSPPR